MNISSIFWNETGRLRSGWRAATFLVLWILFSGILGSIAFVLIGPAAGDAAPGVAQFAAGSTVSLLSAILFGWLCGKWFEGLPFSSLGASFSRGWFRHLVLGMLIGALSLSFAVALAAAFGNFTLVRSPDVDPARLLSSLAASMIVLAIAAAFEEAFFRGYMFQTLTRAGLAWLAILLTAVFFGVLHLGNPSSGIISTIDTAIAGVLFGIAYLRSRDLWFPFGIHLMWNWTQGSVFGIEISGLTDLNSASIFKEVDNGPEWLTGGTYGIEGGVASTAALLVTVAIIYFVPLMKPHTGEHEIAGKRNA